MLKNPNPSTIAKELHVFIPAELSERIDAALTLPNVKSKTQLIIEGLEAVLTKYGK